MAIRTNGNGQLVRTPKAQAATATQQQGGIFGMLDRIKPELERVLPKHLTADRMARIALTALRTNAKLASCDPMSFAASMLNASALGLEPNTPLGLAYLIPYNGQCTLQIGYQGLMELARRSGFVASISATAVYEGDEFSFTRGTSPGVHHVPNLNSPSYGEDQAITYVYCVVHLKEIGTLPIFEVLTRKQVEQRRARGQGGPAWRTDWGAMALKTAVRNALKWCPKSGEVARAFAVEEYQERGSTYAPELMAGELQIGQVGGSFTDDGEIIDEDVAPPKSEPAATAERVREPGEDDE